MATGPDHETGAPSVEHFFAALERERAPRAERERSVDRQRGQGRPVDADGTRTRQNILDAALACFGKLGYDRTTNSQIANEAGISPPTLYHYFDSKAALFQSVADELTRSLYGRIDRLVRERTAVVDRLVAVLDALRDEIERDPDVVGFIATYAAEVRRNRDVLRLSPPALWSGPVEYFESIARSARRNGELSDDVDDAAIAGLMMSVIYGVSLYVAVAPDPTSAVTVIDSYERLLRGALVPQR